MTTDLQNLLNYNLAILIISVLAVLMIIGFFLMVFMLICAHLYLIMKNLTTCTY